MRMGCVDFADCAVSAIASLAMSAALAIAPVLSRSRRDSVIHSLQLDEVGIVSIRYQESVLTLIFRLGLLFQEARFHRAPRPRLPRAGCASKVCERPGYASLPARRLGGRPNDRNRTPQNWRRCLPGSGSYKFVFGRDCALEAARTQINVIEPDPNAPCTIRSYVSSLHPGSLPRASPIALLPSPPTSIACRFRARSSALASRAV